MRTARLMEERDVSFAAELERSCFSEPWSERAFLDAIHDKNALYLIMEENGELAGMCGLWQSFDEADVMNVAVAERFRGKGIAFFLMEELIRRGKERGIEAFSLEVRSSNHPAVDLYKKLGFVTEGVRKNFYDKPKEDALIMWKR